MAAPVAAAAAAPATAVNAPPTAGEIALKRGMDAYGKGNMASAIGSLSSAVSKGGLNASSLAKALYFRGLAYRKQGKPAQAIPDLTNAMWIRDGLDASERADATANRAAAYREAGIADPGVPVQTADATVAPAGGGGAWQTAAASASTPAASASAAPAAATSAAPESGSSGVGGFFSNLFGGGSSQPASGAADVTTASTGPTAVSAVAQPSSAISSWSSGTEVAPGKPDRAAAQRTAAVATTPVNVTDATPPTAHTGKFKLQLAAVRSRGEAEQVVARVVGEHSGKVGQRAPVIEEAVFGNMGTFYRVNVGPYASAGESDAVCKTLRRSGFDCLVVTH